jgi:hypothetical protein
MVSTDHFRRGLRAQFARASAHGSEIRLSALLNCTGCQVAIQDLNMECWPAAKLCRQRCSPEMSF